MNVSRKMGLSLAAATLALATPAMAHPGGAAAHDMLHGFLHPVSGMDHMLAMVAVGLIAARMGGRALWLVPLSFVAMMVMGGMLGLAGIGFPIVETAIAFSVVALGAAVALELKLSIPAAMAVVGTFAVFHGQAHGMEMPADASGLSYVVGFAAATAFLHATGIAIGAGLQRMASARLTRAGGVAVAALGAGLLAGWL